MRALIYHKLTPLVDRLKKEFAHADKNILFSETESYEEALEVVVIYKPEIIVLDVERHDGCENGFLEKIRSYSYDIKEIILSNHPFTKIILIDFSKTKTEVA